MRTPFSDANGPQRVILPPGSVPKRLDELTRTLDKFLKRLSDIEEEFTIMKTDLNRVKAVLREKLGVVLD
jgi:hypothetical protein